MEAETEGYESKNLHYIRKFEEKMKRSKHLKEMVTNNKIIIGGDSGEQILNFFKETNDEVDNDELDIS